MPEEIFPFALVLFTSFCAGSAFADVIIDNGGGGTSSTGSWAVSGGTTPYGANSLWARDGATYRWQFTSQPAGTYEVFMWWSGLSSRATNVPVTIVHRDGSATVSIDQKQNAGKWNSLGQFYFSGTGRVSIKAVNGATVSTCADAVRFVNVGGGVNAPPTAVNDTAATAMNASVAVNVLSNDTDDGGIVAASVAIVTSPVSGTAVPKADGTVTYTPSTGFIGSGSFTYTVADAQGAVSNPATVTVTVNAASTAVVVDTGNSGTSYTGSWAASGATGSYGSNSLWSRDGATYTWSFTPTVSATYDVSMWWTAYSSRSTSIPVDIQHAGGTTRLTINQQQNGGKWNSLGLFSFAGGARYTVKITSQPGPTSTCADAVKFAYLGGGGVNQPPAVTTNAATSITINSATVNGGVNPNGQATTAWFEWSTSPTLSTYSTTAAQANGSGATSQPVTATLSGLTSGTSYYYRVAASNPAGSAKGSIASVNTDETPIGAAPYPPSPIIKAITWAPVSDIIRQAEGSDNWPITWGADDNLYTAYGDGWGFDPKIPDKLSLGFSVISGLPPAFTGVNYRSPTGEQTGDGEAGIKASGMLMMDGVLYMWVRNAGNSQLAWSGDYGRTWSWSTWKFTTSFGCPTFLNFGKNYEGARDGYVYVYSPDNDNAYLPADRMVLARVAKGAITSRDAYEFFNGLDASGNPLWTMDITQRQGVFTHSGKSFRSSISYHAPSKRYLWTQTLPAPGGDPFLPADGFAIFDAPEPWGPWTTVYFTELWDVALGEMSSIPTKWMSDDGKTLYLVFSGDDSFSVRRATLTIEAPPGLSLLGTTNAADSVTINSAMVNGVVNPNGQATTAWFEWGTDPALARFIVTPNQPLGSGTTSHAVKAPLSGLSPGTTYYFRVSASNATGTAKGSIASFRTTAIPAFTWGKATPESQGLDTDKLNEMWSTLQSKRTAAFLVIRNDKIVYEKYVSMNRNRKYYTASMAKGLVGGMSLMVAMNDGLIFPDNLVQQHVPQWTADNIKSTITVRELATHTSGLDDAEEGVLPHDQLTGWKGDFWKLLPGPNDPFTLSRDVAPVLSAPGTVSSYSNPGFAMLSYAVTAALKGTVNQDIRSLLTNRIMKPIGVPSSEWDCGYGRTFTVDGLPLVPSWGGGNYSPNANARVGRLLLRRGDWEGKALLDPTVVQEATTHPIPGLPGYGLFGWWGNIDNNGIQQYSSLPKDAFYAGGSGHQIVLVIPSLNLIMVRNGDFLDDGNYEMAYETYLFAPLMAAVILPTVTMNAATFVTETGGTVNGGVNPNGQATTAWFEWGTDPTLATFSVTPNQSMGSGKTVIPFSESISGLISYGTFYFRAVGSSSVGTQKGAIRSFSTGEDYVAIGDSITMGSHDDIPADSIGYEPILSTLLAASRGPNTIVNEGVSGTSSADGAASISATLSKFPSAKYFLIMYGSDDAYNDNTTTAVPSGMGLIPSDDGYTGSYKDNMQKIISAILAAGKTPYLAEVPYSSDPLRSNGMINEYNVVIDELFLTNDISVTPPPFYAYFQTHPSELADGLHPNGTGYQSMANLWFGALTK